MVDDSPAATPTGYRLQNGLYVPEAAASAPLFEVTVTGFRPTPAPPEEAHARRAP